MAQMHSQRAFVSVVLTMFALTTVSYGQSTKSAQTAETPSVTAQSGDFLYKFGNDSYEFLIVPMPNGKNNGMISEFKGGQKAIVGIIMQDQVVGAGGKPLGDGVRNAYEDWFKKAHGGASSPVAETAPASSATVAGTTPPTQPQNVTASSGGGTPPQVVWDAAAHTVTANGVQFSGDGKHLRMVSGPYANIGGEYETDAGHKALGLIRSAVKGNVYAAGGDPSVKSFWEFYIGRDDQQAKQFFFSTNSMDVGGRSGTPTPFLQQIYDASQQILKVPAQDVPAWFHVPEGMERVKKFLPAASSK